MCLLEKNVGVGSMSSTMITFWYKGNLLLGALEDILLSLRSGGSFIHWLQ